MPPPIRPSSTVGGVSDQWPWLVVAAAVAVAGIDSALWLAFRLDNVFTGHGWTGPSWTIGLVFAAGHRGVTALQSTSVPALVWTLATAILLVALSLLAAPTIWLLRPMLAPRDPARSMASRRDVRALSVAGAAHRAAQLRPSLAEAKEIAPNDRGIALGRLRPSGAPLYASWEDVLLAVMAPRAGKTTSLAVPAILSAPAWAVATSNKADLWAATGALRSAAGRVWTFDPQSIVHAVRTWWWNPISVVVDVAGAHRLAGHFIQEITDGNKTGKDFWAAAAHDLLTSLLLAAAKARYDITRVDGWLNDTSNPEPVDILTRSGDVSAASSLRGRQRGAPDTREGIYETARTAVQCLRDPSIVQWVTPADRGAQLERLDVPAFVRGNDTLYLLSKDGAGAAAPLVAALTDAIMRAAVEEAERCGGRLDPPGVIVLDEAANVCKIADLPDLYSHLGSRGVVPVTILQSYPQGQRVWGEIGMNTLWSAATVKIIGSGIDDPKVAEDISRLVGEEDVDVRSTTWSDGRYSRQLNVRRQRILEAADVRALKRGHAILMVTGIRAALIELLPWYSGPAREAVATAKAAAESELTSRARQPRTSE